MMSRISLAGLTAVAALLLSACGGGGGGGSSRLSNQPAISLSTSSVQQSSDFTSGVAPPSATIVVTGSNMPADGVYVGLDYSSNGIANAYFSGTSDTQGLITIEFRAPTQLRPGAYTDTVTFHTCYDSQCVRPLPGTPKNISVTYTVTGTLSSATIDTTNFAVTGSLRTSQAPVAMANITVTPPMANSPTVVLAGSSNLIQNIDLEQISTAALRLRLNFRGPQSVGAVGTYQDSLTVRLCYDYSCALELQGSPFTLNVTYEVTDNALPEPGLTELPYLTRTQLPHNVVDAEYSAALESIVMVSSSPTSSLYVYDVTNGTSRELRLNRQPTSVSVAPNGLTAAVGHDALITHVDLTTVGQVGAPAPTILNVSTNVFDIVLDGRGVVHAMPAADQWVNLHSVTVATNVETRTTSGPIRAGSKMRLHPSDEYLYLADNGLSPSDIAKVDIRTLPATWLYDSPYHGTYGMCGDLWMKGDGDTIYTKCGNTFRSSTTQSQDMLYSGRLELSISQYYGVTIESLSQSEATDEIALIELVDNYNCGPFSSSSSQCYSHFNLYESDFLNRNAVYAIPPIEVAGRTYSQRGMFVFHSSDGLHRYMISRLNGLPNNGQQFYLTQQQ